MKTVKQLLAENEFKKHEDIFNSSVNASPSEISKGTRALHQWTMGGSYYRPLQNVLRHGSVQGKVTGKTVRTAVPEGNHDDDHPTNSLHGMKNAIDGIMHKTKLSQDMHGKRAVDEDTYNSYVSAAKAGHHVMDKGYTAFSTGHHVSDVSRTHTVTVHAPAGHRVIPMMHHSSAPHEGEALVGRNSVWKPQVNKHGHVEIHLQGHHDDEETLPKT